MVDYVKNMMSVAQCVCDDVVVRLRCIQIINDKGKEESAIASILGIRWY